MCIRDRIWTDYVFYFCMEPIAVRIVLDRSTGRTTCTAATNNRFEIDEVNNCVSIQHEKPTIETIEG